MVSKPGVGIAGALFLILAAIGAATRLAHSASPERPLFQVDTAWPKIPNGWAFGQVSSAAADANDHIWVLHRSRVVRAGQKTGPPVMEFDAAGNYVQGWGGPGDGFEWPRTEHGIFVDYKGFVWIGGNGDDDQILKFTRTGKFVMQIGRLGQKKTNADTRNLWKPADVFVYPQTNELFVADGYGNRRIIVFDADTGAFKRMWGAFGNVPLDDPGPAGRPASGATNPDRVPAKDLAPNDPGPPQFDTIHGVKVSNDGLVYAADRAGKRVQVFTIAGKYVAQAWIDRWCEAVGEGCGNGQTAASTAFSADAEQKFLYVASRSPGRIWVFDRKTLQPLDSFGRPGVGPGEFFVLHHMTTDSKGNLYTSEVQDGRRIQKFALKGFTSAQRSDK
jgi:DNA-binding beta-propeller fold protein YncE